MTPDLFFDPCSVLRVTAERYAECACNWAKELVWAGEDNDESGREKSPGTESPHGAILASDCYLQHSAKRLRWRSGE